MFNPQGPMLNAFFIESLKRDIDQALHEARNGTPVNYSLFASRLTSGEAEWLKEHEKVAKVSSAKTIPVTNDESSKEGKDKAKADRGWNRTTGEPTMRWINGVDVSIVYQQTHKVDEDDFKILPNIVKDYFRSNSQKKCPPKIQNMERPKKTQPKKKKKKSDQD